MENKEIKALVDKINVEWEEMKRVLNGEATEEKRKFGVALGDTNAKLDRISTTIGEFETKFVALQTAAARPDFGRPGGAAGKKVNRRGEPLNDGEVAYSKAFLDWCRKGGQARDSIAAMHDAIEKKALYVTDDTTGGFLASPDIDAEIIKGVIDISEFRPLVRVRNTGKRSVKVRKRTGQFAAAWVSETGTRTETTGYTVGMEEIPNHEVYAMVDISRQDLEDSDFDLEAELREEASEQFALLEGTGFVSGTGNGQMEGINVNAAVSNDVSGHATQVTYAGYVDVSHNIKAGYVNLANVRFILNLKTLGATRKLADGQGMPLWTSMAAGAPATILGYPYTIIQALPDEGAGKFPVFFGDFRRAYYLVDRLQMTVQRDDVTQGASGVVRFWFYKRLGGQVVVAEAIRKMKNSV